MNRLMNKLMICAAFELTMGPQIALAVTKTSPAKAGTLSAEATAGLAAGYGLFGVGAFYGINESLSIGVTGGVAILNTHTGLQGRYYFLRGRTLSPVACATVSSFGSHGYRTMLLAAGGGLDISFLSGFYLQAMGGWMVPAFGTGWSGDPYGAFEGRPIAVGMRF